MKKYPECPQCPGKLSLGDVMRYPIALSVSCFILVFQATDAQVSSNERICFVDRSDADLEFIYIIRGKQLFVQQAVFPGHTEQRWFFHAQLSDETSSLLAKWHARAGDKPSKSVPDSRWYIRLTITDQGKEKMALFHDDNDAATSFFSYLKRRFTKKDSATSELPNWIKNEKRLLHLINPEAY